MSQFFYSYSSLVRSSKADFWVLLEQNCLQARYPSCWPTNSTLALEGKTKWLMLGEIAAIYFWQHLLDDFV